VLPFKRGEEESVQVLDPTGKGVSQEVVTININQRANQILLSYKTMSNDMVQLAKRQAQLMDRM
jgi:hypothetical protein